jgi:methyl-accepting chemotaxis protein
VEQVCHAIQTLDKNTQQNATLVEHTSAAAEGLRQQADALHNELANFKVG